MPIALVIIVPVPIAPMIIRMPIMTPIVIIGLFEGDPQSRAFAGSSRWMLRKNIVKQATDLAEPDLALQLVPISFDAARAFLEVMA
jgi:hypothetical protein